MLSCLVVVGGGVKEGGGGCKLYRLGRFLAWIASAEDYEIWCSWASMSLYFFSYAHPLGQILDRTPHPHKLKQILTRRCGHLQMGTDEQRHVLSKRRGSIISRRTILKSYQQHPSKSKHNALQLDGVSDIRCGTGFLISKENVGLGRCCSVEHIWIRH